MALRNELLGPRIGHKETLENDPKEEYVVGVLEPKDFKRGALAFYGRSDFARNETGEGEESEMADENEFSEFGFIADPRALPKSMGISFVVNKNSGTEISVCATWARYLQEGKIWKRSPFAFVRHGVDVKVAGDLYKENGVRICLEVAQTGQGHHYVSIYIVNEAKLPKGHHVQTEDYLFQPQLRIVSSKNTIIVPISQEDYEEDSEDASLSLVYRGKEALAKGHLCSAIWKTVDPEREHPTKPNPMKWIDAEALDEPDRTFFAKPDFRTEYLPCFPIQQLTMTPKAEYGNFGPFQARVLAQTWDSSELESSLEYIAKGYERWIEDRKNELSHITPHFSKIGKIHLEKCEDSARRIREGIRILKSDEDAKLAFCFMNKVMDQQSVWKKKGPLTWRLFQIAFILQCVPSVAEEDHKDRQICDMLWFPTAGGKTEAYLGLSIFSIALRRRRNRQRENGGIGTGVISRYTLRMLTIQQFRRATIAIVACDYLRMKDWRPDDYISKEKNLWGTARFSIGLWVGQDVTPNRLVDHKGFDRIERRRVVYPGAVSRLMGFEIFRGTGVKLKSATDSEPAQVIKCPVCDSILAVPKKQSLPPDDYTFHFIVKAKTPPKPALGALTGLGVTVKNAKVTTMPSADHHIVSIDITSSSKVGAEQIDNWWNSVVLPALGPNCKGAFARASRLGYFLKRLGIQREPADYEIHCPNPKCELNAVDWFEAISADNETYYTEALPPFRIPGKEGFWYGVPISAYVVDDQIYHRCPSIVIATVDKFARIAFEPRSASMFGNIGKYDSFWGFYREEAPPDRGEMDAGDICDVQKFNPPDLIVQDELHLIEGPLGTMVGLYETAIETLSCKIGSKGKIVRPKYLASSATIRHAKSQVKAVFDRNVSVFPAQGLSIDDNFFSHSEEKHWLDSEPAGRLYFGVCSPGRGPHTPTKVIWATLLKKGYELRLAAGPANEEADQFWTLVGYFNAIKELAQALGLYRADVKDWLRHMSGNIRNLGPAIELSSRMPSAEIPIFLEQLSKKPPNYVDAVFCTSMFGTGVDVDRLGLMVVHGQPKTTANYIQATGRVGRLKGGLVVVFLRATRPRDLDHYEFFIGYHRCLPKFVEPITVHPFSPRARERALGPIAVSLLRNGNDVLGTPVKTNWISDDVGSGALTSIGQGALTMKTERHSPEVNEIIEIIRERSKIQPKECCPVEKTILQEINSWLDRWQSTAQSKPSLVYSEVTLTKEPEKHVVLGDPQHKIKGKICVFENTPQSLREVEATTTFEG
jgi:hypothetical protein